MSDWGDDELQPAPAGAVDARTGEVGGVTPDLAAVRAAEAALSAARRALDVAESKLGEAEDALADAEDELGVAETKADDYAGDETKQAWQLAAVRRDVAKRTRARKRADERVSKRRAELASARQTVVSAEADLRLALSTPAPPEPEEPGLYYGSVDEFLREYLRHVYSRRIDGRHRCWAGRWWEYSEAVIRLEALWRSWEHLRQDPATGMSVWWRDHADHHMAMLMDPDGPFASAAEGEENRCRRGEPLPYIPPPDGLFPDVRTTTT